MQNNSPNMSVQDHQDLTEDSGALRDIADYFVCIPMRTSDTSKTVVATGPPIDGTPARVSSPAHLVLPILSKWKPGRVLKVQLRGGSEEEQDEVKECAAIWQAYANMKFDFVDSDSAEIRVAFEKGKGNWSYVGTDNLKVDSLEPTMNLDLHDEDQEDFAAIILHEFGHALGCSHEHQNPANNISWNDQVVIDHYFRKYGWSKDQTKREVLSRDDWNTNQFSEYDPPSIMHYDIIRKFTTDGFWVPRNQTLSETDEKFIRILYPFPTDRRIRSDGSRRQRRRWY
jgi:hypothetical protein